MPAKDGMMGGLTMITALSVVVVAVLLSVIKYQIQLIPRTSYHDQVYIEDSATKDQLRYRVITSVESTRGKFCITEILVRPGSVKSAFYPDRPGSPPLHVHLYSQEIFDVKAGVMSYELNGTTGTVEAGAAVAIPAGVPHTFWNAEPNTSLLVHVTLTPPGLGDFFLENFAALGAEYGSISNMNPLQLFVTLKAADVVPMVFPAPVWWVIQNVVCPFSQWLGFRPTYEAYRSLHEPLETVNPTQVNPQ